MPTLTPRSVLLVAGLLTPAAPAQTKAANPPSRDAIVATLQAQARAHIVYDAPRCGEIWALAESYKAGFTGTAFTFIPFLGADAPRNFPVEFRLRAVTVAGVDLALSAGEPVRIADRVCVDRGALVEIYDLAPRQVEQSFALASLPARGELRIALAVASDLEAADAVDGITFTGALGSVRYDHAVVIDAAGARLSLPIRLRDHTIELVVPASFVQGARLPLVVDPVVARQTVASSRVRGPSVEVDVAYDASLDRYAVVYQSYFSATDHDMWLVRYDAALQTVGVEVVVDNSDIDWRRPRIACSEGDDRFCVVAEVGVAGTSWIAGRTYGPTGHAVTAQFVVEKEGSGPSLPGSKRNPDIAGDATGVANGWFTVVWQCYETSSYDIHMRQIAADGSQRLPATTRVANTLSQETYPAISSCGGVGRPETQQWMIVFQRSRGIEGAPNDDILGAMLGADGQLVLTPSGFTFPIDGSNSHHLRPSVSSPTHPVAGRTTFLVAYHDLRIGGDSDIQVALVGNDAHVDLSTNLTTLDTFTSARARPQFNATVDTDGLRFAVAYTEQYDATDLDTYVSAIAIDALAPALVVHDARAPLRTTVSVDRDPRVFALRSGGGRNDGPRYIAAHKTDNDFTQAYTEVMLYDGVQAGGYASRPTGCSGSTIAATGTPAIGHAIEFHFAGGPGHGFFLGLPASVPLPCASGCVVGTDLSMVVFAAPCALTIPSDVNLVGAVVAVQGFSVGLGGTCMGTIALSNTLDVTVQ